MKWFNMMSIVLLSMFVNVGCASASGSDYYEAVQRAAEAKALASEARYQALAKVASSGDGQAASAAVMAIALSSDDPIVPQYIESSALKWAQVLTPTIGTLGLGIVQANVAKNAADNAAKVQMASMQANTDIQLGQQAMITNMGGQWADVASAGGQATVDVALAGFGALNNAGDQTVQLGLAGLTTADSIATTGFTTVDSVATTGINAIGSVSTTGMNNLNELGQYGMTTVGAVATVGMDNLNEMGQFGMTTVGAIGTHGMDTAETLGIQGMLGIHETNEDWLNYSTTRDTNISQILADFQESIRQFGTDLSTPITCNDDGNGVFTCTGG